MNNKKLETPHAIIIAGIIIALSILGSKIIFPIQEKVAQEETSNQNKLTRLLQQDDHILGNPNAQIVLFEFSDIECPFCKIYHFELKKVLEKFPNDIAIVFRHFPIESLHKNAWAEAIATECVALLSNNKTFWTYLDKIFETTTSNDGLDLKNLNLFAKELGINNNDFSTCLESEEALNLVTEDYNEAKEIKANGTPSTVLLNTKTGEQIFFVGAKKSEDLEKIISDILK